MYPDFADTFVAYVQNAKNAVNTDRPERKLVHLFTDFLTRTFDVEIDKISFEQHVPMASIRRRGFIDVLFGDLVFEFKRQITHNAEQSRDQLEKYLRHLEGNYTGLLTDGLRFEAYILADDKLKRIGDFNLEEMDAEAAYTRLEGYLFSQKNKLPTSADVVDRFGGKTPTFQIAFQKLTELLKRVDTNPMLGVWREQWRKLLSKVYGSDIGSDDLFLRHTYLC